MSAAAESRTQLPPIEEHRAAALVHEAILQATRELAPHQAAWALIAKVVEQHGPHNPPISGLFATLNGQPVCRGCERAQHTPTRDPQWPGRTYKLLAHDLLQLEAVYAWLPEEPEKRDALMIILDDHRAPPDPGRHRGPGGIDAGSGASRGPSLRLSTESTVTEGTGEDR